MPRSKWGPDVVSDKLQKHVKDMTKEERRAALAEIIRNPPGMSAAERADLAALRGDPPPKHVRDMTREEFEIAKRKLIRDSYT